MEFEKKAIWVHRLGKFVVETAALPTDKRVTTQSTASILIRPTTINAINMPLSAATI
jgi:hypothetical protein